MYIYFHALAEAVPKLDDEETRRWIAAARDGDERVHGKLYQAYVQRVYRTVRGIAPSDADDVVQECFVRAFRSLDRFDDTAGKFSSWLLTIAVNEAKRFAVRRSRRLESGLNVDGDEIIAADEKSPDETLRGEVIAALQTLSARDRDIVCLRYGGELSVAEVAEASGESEANVRKICERSREQLEPRLERVWRSHA